MTERACAAAAFVSSLSLSSRKMSIFSASCSFRIFRFSGLRAERARARAAAEWEALMLFVGATEGLTDTLPFSVYLDWNGAMMGWVVSSSLVCVLLAVAAAGAVRLLAGRTYVW